jgi:hypothetical protein
MTMPTDDQRQRAEWDLLLLDIEQRRKQSRWETPRAVAMILLALAANHQRASRPTNRRASRSAGGRARGAEMTFDASDPVTKREPQIRSRANLLGVKRFVTIWWPRHRHQALEGGAQNRQPGAVAGPRRQT